MKKYFFPTLIYVLFLAALLPQAEAATQKFTYAGWMPYWTQSTGVPDVLANLPKLGEVSPFSYEVQANGSLSDKLKLDQDPWPQFLAAAKAAKTKIIPSVVWMDAPQIYKTLSSSTLRIAQEKSIVALAVVNNFDGIDIDYEGKSVETKPYFSKFITELSTAMHKEKKVLTCDIEPRTPLSSRFSVIPADVEYSNDYAVLGKYCDEFRIMAYDQRNIDVKLNKSKGTDALYIPVADTAWVTKVVNEALKSVPRSKIVLGIPSYGHEYVAADTKSSRTYTRVRAITYADAITLAASMGVTPGRNSAGELSFTYYAPSTSTLASISSVKGTTHVVWFDDAAAINQKIELAKKLGLAGAVLFRFDGKSDPAIWNVLK